jgi:hypothetical protein
VVHFGLLALAQKYFKIASHEKLIGLSRAGAVLSMLYRKWKLEILSAQDGVS